MSGKFHSPCSLRPYWNQQRLLVLVKVMRLVEFYPRQHIYLVYTWDTLPLGWWCATCIDLPQIRWLIKGAAIQYASTKFGSGSKHHTSLDHSNLIRIFAPIPSGKKMTRVGWTKRGQVFCPYTIALAWTCGSHNLQDLLDVRYFSCAPQLQFRNFAASLDQDQDSKM